MKKLLFTLLCCSFFLTACGSSSDELTTAANETIVEEESIVEVPEEPIEEPEAEAPEIEAPEVEAPVEDPVEVSTDQFVTDVQSAIQGDVGAGESITDVKLDNGKLYVYVDLSNGDFSTFSPADIARSRTSSITDDILALEQYDSLWDSIIVDFGEVGYLENSHSAIKDEGYGRYFDLESASSVDHLDNNAVISAPAASASKSKNETSVAASKSNVSADSPDVIVSDTPTPSDQADSATPEEAPQQEEPAPVEEPPAPEPEEEQPKPIMVWLSATGEKYHSINNCGRMNPDKARQVTLEDAQNQGYEPCSKCY